MANITKCHNISIQPLKITRSSTKNVFVLSNDGLTNEEINRKSTSHKIKTRVAHIPKFPRPVIKKPNLPTQQEKLKFKNPKVIKPDQKIPEKVLSKTNQISNKQQTNLTKLRKCITSIPWSYNEIRDKNISLKRKIYDLETEVMKKQKITEIKGQLWM